MSFQFAHVNTYSLKSGGENIAAEAGRKPENCQHVEHPLPPVLLAGVSTDEAWAEIERRHGAARTTKITKHGPQIQKIRRDENVMLAAVVSWPVKTEDLDQSDPIFREWLGKSVAWLEKEHGPALSAVLHLDESHPHIHFITAPDLEAGQRMQDIHPGFKAREAAGGKAAKKSIKDRSWREAMGNWQDRYYQEVAVEYGQARLGPKRQRLNRAEWGARKAENARIAEERRKAAEMTSKAEKVQRAIRDVNERHKVVRGREQKLKGVGAKLVAVFTLGLISIKKSRSEGATEERGRWEVIVEGLKASLQTEKQRREAAEIKAGAMKRLVAHHEHKIREIELDLEMALSPKNSKNSTPVKRPDGPELDR